MLTGMEVANASMYDGSTATAEAVLMAHRVTKRKKAVLSGNLHPHYRETVETVSRMADHDGRGAAADRRDGAEEILAAIDDETVLRRRADAGLLRPAARPAADRREGARGRRAAGRGVHRGRLARAGRAAGRDGRRHRRRRGPVDRQCADLRRALCRPVRDAAEIRAADAGPACRRDGRCRGPARLRADALDARAAHPPREGDLQHLHQFRPVRARLHAST